MNTKKLIPLCAIQLCVIAIFSCTSFNVADRVYKSSGGHVKKVKPPESAKELSDGVIIVPVENPAPLLVEKPVYVPATEAEPRKTSAGRESVAASNVSGIIKPQDYNYSAMTYDYNPNWVYEVYTQPLRVTDVYLAPGERSVEAPFISDSERWMLGASVSYDNGVPVQHIYIKPIVSGLEASLIINTNERVYHLILRSFKDVHMPKVIWRYSGVQMPQTYLKENGKIAADSTSASGGAGKSGTQSEIIIDPRVLNFNYKITHTLFKAPQWVPKLVYDDGKKTYITFPPDILNSVMPAVFENRNDIVNYRVVDNVIIIDKRIELITIKIEKQQIVVRKK